MPSYIEEEVLKRKNMLTKQSEWQQWWYGDRWQGKQYPGAEKVDNTWQPSPYQMSTPPERDRSYIDDLIRKYRQSGTQRIGTQLGQANVATAGQLASRGLGSSTITTGALQANQARAFGELGDLEAKLAGIEAQALSEEQEMALRQWSTQEQLGLSQWSTEQGLNQRTWLQGREEEMMRYQMMQQRKAQKGNFLQDLFGGALDIGGMMLLGSVLGPAAPTVTGTTTLFNQSNLA